MKLVQKPGSVRRFGLRPSAVVADLRYRNERLSYLSYSFDTLGLTSSGRPRELLAEVRFQDHTNFEQHESYHVGMDLSLVHSLYGKQGDGKLRLVAIVTPQATGEERNSAFDFDLSCISTFRGCRAACEVMPSVWKEALRRSQNKEISLPQEELENPVCSPQ
jgi:hypothetical protein